MKTHLPALSGLLSIPLLGLLYVYLNNDGDRQIYSLVTDLDRQTPFLSVFVVPYLGWFVFIFACFVYLAVQNRSVYWTTLLRFNIGLIACYGIYAVFQTYVPRPPVPGDGLLNQLVGYVYAMDQPFNCFPSTHVFTSYCMIKAFHSAANIGRPVKIAVTAMSLTVIASTLFVKQHVLMDVAGAIALAEAIYFVGERLKAWKTSGQRADKTPKQPLAAASRHGSAASRQI